MKKIKRIVLLSIVAAVAIPFAGCSKKTDSSAKNNGAVEQQKESGVKNDAKKPQETEAQKKTEAFPDFELKSLKDDSKKDNSVFKNSKLTIINVWQSACPPCMEELKVLNELYSEYDRKDLNIIGFNVDMDEEPAKKVISDLKLDFDSLHMDADTLQKIVEMVPGTPTSFYIGSDGKFLKDPVVGFNASKPEQAKQDLQKEIDELIK